MENCIFCKIIAGDIPSKKVYEDEHALAFWDIDPAAPVHVLVIPKKHIKSAIDLSPEDGELIAHLFKVVKKVAQALNIDESGFRLATNVGEDGGQSVHHLHFHVLAGKAFGKSFG